jgi:glycosidase
MVGDKPDERLRTPMQWSARRGLGFTSGKPWESAQPDSFTTTVDAQTGDRGSLLTLYRRLIHLRRTNAALGTGTLIPLSANNPGVVAYVRRSGGRAVLVVANLSGAEVGGLTVGSTSRVLPRGRYAPRSLLGGRDGVVLIVAADGAVRNYAPISGSLGRGETLVLDLVSR